MQRDFGTTFVTQCAPVMAGLKAANLFRWVEPDAGALAALLDAWRSQLGPRGVQIEVLKSCPRRLAEQRGVTDDLKRHRPLEWAAQMQALQAQAEEIVCCELIYI